VDPIFLVSAECLAITSAMRKNARWANSGVSSILRGPSDTNGRSGSDIRSRLGLRTRGSEFTAAVDAHHHHHHHESTERGPDDPLIEAFARLRVAVAQLDSLEHFDMYQLFLPFIEVIRSPSTTGPITAMAITAVNKFFDYNIVSTRSVNLQHAVCQLSIAITHCRFDATDQADDDAVLLKILKLMDTLVGGASGDLLNDESMCEIFETCLSMACQLRRSNVLRRSAENTILDITQKAFSKLRRLEPEQEIPVGAPIAQEEVVVNAPGVVDTIVREEGAPGEEPKEEPKGETKEENKEETKEETKDEVNEEPSKEPNETPRDQKGEKDEKEMAATETTTSSTSTFGIPAIREFYRVLTSILDPANHHQYTESTRVMSLQLINVVFEVAGKELTKHHSLLQITTDTLCKHLFKIIRMDSLPLVQGALRVISTMLHTTRSHLKLQQEFLLVYFMSCCCPLDGPSDDPSSDITAPSILLEKNFNYSNSQLGEISKPGTPRPDSSSPGADDNINGTPSPTQAQFATSRSPEIREAMVETLSTLCREPYFFAELFLNFDCDVDRVNLCENMMQFLCRSAYPDAAQWSSSSVPPFCLDVVLQHLSKLVGRLDQNGDDKKEAASELVARKARKKEIVEAIDAFNVNPKVGIQKFLSGGLIKDTSPTEIGSFLFQSSRINKAKLGEFLSKPANLPTLKAYTAQFDFDGKRVDMALRQYLSAFRLPGESQQIERVMECFAEHYSSFSENQSVVKNSNDGVVLCFSIIMLNTDLHNPQVKNHMSLDQYKRNLRGQCDGQDYEAEFLESIYNDIKTREIVMPDEHDSNESFEHSWGELLMKTDQAGLMTTDLNSNAFDRYVFEVTWRPIVAMLTRVFSAATDDAVFSRVISGLDQLASLASDFDIDEVINVILDRVGGIMAALGEPIDSLQNIDVWVDPSQTDPITVSDLSVQFGLDFKAQIAAVVYFTIVSNHSEHLSDDVFVFVAKVLNNIYENGLHPTPLFGAFESTEKSAFKNDLPRIAAPNKFKKYESGKEGVGLLSTLSSYLTGGYNENNQPTDEEIEATLSALDCLASCKVDELFGRLQTGEEPTVQFVNALTGVPSIYSFHLMALLGQKNSHVTTLVIDRFGDSLDDGATINYLAGLQKDSGKLFAQLLKVDSVVLRSLAPEIDSLILSFALFDNTDYLEVVKILASNVASSERVFELIEKHVDDIPVANLVSILDEFVSVSSVGAPLEQRGLVLDSLTASSSEKDVDKLLSKVKSKREDTKQTVEHVIRGLKALQLAHKAAFTHNTSAYIEFLAHQSYNPCRRIRSETLKTLENLLRDKEIYSQPGFSWEESVFENGLFPLVKELLKPEVYELDSAGMGSTRVKGAMLLCRTFLHYVDAAEANGGDFDSVHAQVIQLWLTMLTMLDRLMSSSSDAQEALVESLKNVLLVLVSSKHLDPQQGGSDWDDSWNRLDQFVPGLRTDLFPDSKEPEVKRAT
jgi:brefeldin A-resistance guanine nucleotide exchange factor 1